ncbi:MAG: glycine dehydrogenase, partial [Exilibacterium sp.]
MSGSLHNEPLTELENRDSFIQRHIGPDAAQTHAMLETLGVDSIAELIEKTVPENIRKTDTLALKSAVGEDQALAELKTIAAKNQIFKSYIGMGYHNTLVPKVIQRNVLENPGWYTAYTPYQPEIAQGRLEGLLNFQQMVLDLTGMEMANASMLDEGTAAAEAMAMCKRQLKKNKSSTFFVDSATHPQTIAVIQTRAEHFGFEIVVGDPKTDLAQLECFGALLQYPATHGEIKDLSAVIDTIHAKGALATVAADILSLVLLKAPAEMGADVVVGSNQRFGVPMGFGGPHAAFFAFRDKYKRSAPGRIIGVSIDSRGRQSLRMAMQTREQHIRREKANSNICTSQVLLALMSVFYAIYHGPEGLKRIAGRIHRLTGILAEGLRVKGFELANQTYFDTLTLVTNEQTQALFDKALGEKINLRRCDDKHLSISLHERTTVNDVQQ